MADETKKSIEIGLNIDARQAKDLESVFTRLGQAADILAQKFAAMNNAMGGTAASAAGATGRPLVGVATGAAGAASRESPLLAQFRATNQYLTDTYLKTLQKVAEAQRGITAFGPRSGLGGGGGVAAGGGPILDPYGRPARPLDDVALPTSRTTGPSLSQLEVDTVTINAKTVNINGEGIGGGAGGGAGGGGDGGGGTSPKGTPQGGGARTGIGLQSKMAALQTILGVAETGVDLYKYYTTSELRNQAGQQATNAYLYGNMLSGRMAPLAAIQEMGGLSAIQNQYGLGGANTVSKYLSIAGGLAQTATGVAGMLGGAAAGGIAGAAVGSVVPVVGTTVGGIVGAIGGGIFGGMVTRGISTTGRSVVDLMTGKVGAEEQQNIVAAIEEYQKTKPFEYMAMELFDQQRSGMIANQRGLGRVGIGGPRAYDLANILPATYGISTSDAMSIAQSAARGRTFRGDEEKYRSTISTLGGLQAAGYSQSVGTNLMNMVNMLEIGGYAPPNVFKRGGRKSFSESSLLMDVFRFGDQNIEEAVISQAQSGMMGYGGLASAGGISTYANMLGTGVTNAQQVMLRQQGINALGAISQEPLAQAMSMMEFKKLVPRATVAQQQIAAKLRPEEYGDTEKIMKLINPYGPKVVNGIPQAGYLKSFAEAQAVGERMQANLFDVAQSQTVERGGQLGQLLKGKKKGFLSEFIESGQTDPKYAGYMAELAQSLAGTVGGVSQAEQMIEAYARRKVKVTGRAAADAADPRLVGAERVTAATQTEALYAGFNQALTTLQSTFSNAQSEITNIISQLSNNTAANMTGGKMVGTANK
jgi:hypothetical protein